jgi:predicted alpha-1,2-mannosidase
MAKLGPTTDGHYGNKSGWEAVGYDERHTSIEGFANLHEFQIGGFKLMPTTGNLITIPGELENPDSGYRSRFDKADEVAGPGYYKVKLKDYNVTAELTATKRVGFHRYTFPDSEQSNIIFDIGNELGESGDVKDAYVKFNGVDEIVGYVVTIPKYVIKYQPGADVSMYFVAKINKKPKSFGVFNKENIKKNINETSGVGAGVFLSYSTYENESVEVKMGLSYTSIENARLNLDIEAAGMSFDDALEASNIIWDNELGKITVEGGTEKDKVKFYTALYHVLLGRGVVNDVNGAYPRNDGSVGQLPLDKYGNPEFSFYNTDAIWGAFWNLTQLWTLVWPDYLNDFVRTQLQVYQDAGWLGDGIANSRFVSGVGTNFIGLVIAAAHSCGIDNYDVDLAYEAALKDNVEYHNRNRGAGKFDLKPFIEKGFIPYREEWVMDSVASKFAASRTLEYCFSSYAVAQMAKTLGKNDDYLRLMELSDKWRFIYDDDLNLIRPRDENGEFIKNFDPTEPWIGFQEGNANSYTYYIPHNPEALMEKMGVDEFNNGLEEVFKASKDVAFCGGKDNIDAFSGLRFAYNHGNQPCLHMSWLFNYSGKPELTQYWTRSICNEFYGTTGVHGYGYGQDEDQGQLSGWYVMASMGLFDVKGLCEQNPSFQIGSPLFDKITLKLNPEYSTGKTIEINANNNGPENYYIQDVKINGAKRDKLQVSVEELFKGAVINLEMGNKPGHN